MAMSLQRLNKSLTACTLALSTQLICNMTSSDTVGNNASSGASGWGNAAIAKPDDEPMMVGVRNGKVRGTTRSGGKTTPLKKGTSPKEFELKVKILNPTQLNALLKQRLNGTLGDNFGQFSNMFFVRSRIDLDTGIALTTKAPGVTECQLEPAFAYNYKPTLRELLDAIALETGTRWVYADRSQVMVSNSPSNEIIDGMAIFDFVPNQHKFTHEMTPAKDWKAVEKTNWVMYIPPIAPMAMDYHELGKVSADDKSKEAALIAKTAQDFALDQYRRAKPDAKLEDLKKTKVGAIDAYYFETPLPPTGPEKVRWRQWHFMIGNQLCYVISTILPDQEKALWPDVEQMIKTFNAKESSQDSNK